jgi:hypothetical protein
MARAPRSPISTTIQQPQREAIVPGPRRQLREAEASWLSLARRDGEPQVVTLIAVPLEDGGRVVECGELEEVRVACRGEREG